MKPIDINGVAALCLVSDRTAEKYVIDPTFPPAIRPGGRSRIWEEVEVIAWIRAQRDDKNLIDDLAGQYDDGSDLDPVPVEFITPSEFDLLEEVSSNAVAVEDLDPAFVRGIVDKITDLGLLQMSGHAYPVFGPDYKPSHQAQ